MGIDETRIEVGPKEIHRIHGGGKSVFPFLEGMDAEDFAVLNGDMTVEVVEAVPVKLRDVDIRQCNIGFKGRSAARDTHNEQCKKGVQICFHAGKVGSAGRTFVTKHYTWIQPP